MEDAVEQLQQAIKIHKEAVADATLDADANSPPAQQDKGGERRQEQREQESHGQHGSQQDAAQLEPHEHAEDWTPVVDFSSLPRLVRLSLSLSLSDCLSL